MKQELLWIPEGVDTGAFAKLCRVAYTGPKPARVWTLLNECAQLIPPIMPFVPKHHHNAFLEDYMHDWDIRQGMFHYHGVARDGNNWILLEFEE